MPRPQSWSLVWHTDRGITSHTSRPPSLQIGETGAVSSGQRNTTDQGKKRSEEVTLSSMHEGPTSLQ